MQKLKLGQKNDLIQWSNNHEEINKLVNQYNKMIVALDKSAEQLARTQREIDALVSQFTDVSDENPMPHETIEKIVQRVIQQLQSVNS